MLPGRFGMLTTKSVGQFIGGLTHDLNIFDDTIIL